MADILQGRPSMSYGTTSTYKAAFKRATSSLHNSGPRAAQHLSTTTPRAIPSTKTTTAGPTATAWTTAGPNATACSTATATPFAGKGCVYVYNSAGTQQGFLISAGKWHNIAGTPATYTSSSITGQGPFTLTTSKSLCGIKADNSLLCGASITTGAQFYSNGSLLQYGDSSYFSAATTPSGQTQGTLFADDAMAVYVTLSSSVRNAILSHTWNGDDEATFAEVKNGCDMDAPRFDKVRMTCSQAAKDGYDYAWVDSCCINRDSLTELAEAINSMWRRYYDAAVCYVFLSDLDPACPVLEDVASIFCIEGTRAATADWELLASKDVNFYCASVSSTDDGGLWGFVGYKHSLVRTLWEITGIDLLALQDRDSLTRFVTALKMYWASRRKTIKIEDRAYSLLGLFNIHMPLLYGEGDKAFVRLQEEIIQKRLDHSIFAWDTTRFDPAQSADLLFANSPEKFALTGRWMTRWHWSSYESALSVD
ncbi:hypothetical protein B0A48_09011 [Cryoendolithus antarcticus]|uniref:Uncharacterized protein n=1 Tax=Cryoendolithus antarcticus TaxID=1507870 RepID=A0A1V8T1Q8_9PEZI|nr:hypothetical protein B0A48_09011 [Cryoendolithus antarcticus]